MQGRGILSGLTLGTETAEGDDPSPDFGSLWALAVREAVRRNQINDLNATEERTSNQPQLFNNSDPGVQWPGACVGCRLWICSTSRRGFVATVQLTERMARNARCAQFRQRKPAVSHARWYGR